MATWSDTSSCRRSSAPTMRTMPARASARRRRRDVDSRILMAAAVTNSQRRVAVSRARLSRATERAMAAVGRRTGHVDVLIVDDAAIKRLNRLHRGVDRRTDVLAYPLEAPG